MSFELEAELAKELDRRCEVLHDDADVVDGRPALAAVNALGAVSVAFTLAVNLGRGYPMISLAATALIAGCLYALSRRAGRPTGVEELERLAESEE